MKAPSTHWQDVTPPVCSEYEELFQQWVIILGQLRFSNQEVQHHQRISIQNEEMLRGGESDSVTESTIGEPRREISGRLGEAARRKG